MNLTKKIGLLVLVLCILALGTSLCSASVEFTDSTGKSITIPAVADRVVCLNSDCAETMVVLGIGDNVVGVAESTTKDNVLMSHLPKATSIGEWQTPNVERVLALKPDAVITYSSSRPKNADQFAQAGINLIYLDCYKIDTLEHDIRALGTITGTEPAAEKYLKFLDTWKKTVTDRISGISPEQVPTVYAEGYSDYSGQGKNSGTDLLITLAKGKNLAGDLGEAWPKVTPEWIVSEDPHVILKVVAVKPDKTLDQVRTDLISRTGFETLSAIKNNRVYVMNGDLAFGPRSPVGLVYIARMLHPEQFSDISPSDVLKEYAETFVSGTESGDYFSPVL